jgi:hypothetical protein
METDSLRNLVACFHFRPQGKPIYPVSRLEASWNSKNGETGGRHTP